MSKRVGIIGTGWVGTSVAMSCLHTGAADELWLHDSRAAVAEGEAMDLTHGAMFYPACTVRAADLSEMRQADVVVVAAELGSTCCATTPGWWPRSAARWSASRARWCW